MADSHHIVCPHCDSVNRVPSDRLRNEPICGKCSHLLFSGHPLALNQSNFEKHITRNDIPVLIDFWAPWCGPCRAMAPAYEKAATMLEPLMRVAKLNTEDAQEIAARYVIRSIPTLVMLINGRESARQPGAMDSSGIVNWAKSKAGLTATTR